MPHKDVESLKKAITNVIALTAKGIKIKDIEALQKHLIDELLLDACLGEKNVQELARWIIHEAALELGIIPASIHNLYEARGKNAYSRITVPAVNIRGLTYDVARALIRAALKNNSFAFIFEIAKTEIGYTMQHPNEYTIVCLAAAIKERFQGPIFIQGDHCQVNAKKYSKSPKEEVDGVKRLIKEEIEAGFYNIDIDTSTLVDLSKATVDDQQRLNYELAAELTNFIRSNEPKGVTISVGGEIGEVGGKNSTPEEFKAYMNGYLKKLNELNPNM